MQTRAKYAMVAVSAAFAVLATSVHAANDLYPNRPISLVVPFGVGSGSDTQARILAKAMGTVLNVPIVVENRPGASGIIGTKYVADSAADGYVVLFGSGTGNAVNYSLYPKKTSYRPEDFKAVSMVSLNPVALFASSAGVASSVKSPEALFEGSLKGSCGSGNTITEVACKRFADLTKSDLVSTSYKGNAQSMSDLAGGQIDFAFSDLVAGSPFLQSGKVVPLAAAADQRLAPIPNTPTFSELGFPELQLTSWGALFVPAATPEGVVQTLHKAAVQAISAPEWEARRQKEGSIRVTYDLGETRQFVDKEIERWRDLIARTGLRNE